MKRCWGINMHWGVVFGQFVAYHTADNNYGLLLHLVMKVILTCIP